MSRHGINRKKRAPSKLFSACFNILTVIVLLTTVCAAIGFISIFFDPKSSLNVLQPPTLPPAVALPTLTPTALHIFPATWTPVPSETPIPTKTQAPTPSETAFPINTSSVVPTEPTNPPYAIAQGSPVAISSVTYHPEAGCNWMGVAGQVLDLSGAPVPNGVIIQLHGNLEGENKEFTGLTGTALQYGKAGFEIVLSSKPVATSGALWLQLLDQSGQPISPKTYFDTYNTCDKNLVLINFKQTH